MNNFGWECPRCGKINAPWNPSCDCKATMEKTVVEAGCEHVWECTGMNTSSNTFRCKKCGMEKNEPHVYRETTTEETHD
jgi:predicted RNA-binding Zn-ribbon protein involved in translation (DUF1610 family)